MKIFVTSDIHGNLDIVKKLVGFLKNQQDIKYIILCGDITSDYRGYDYEWLQIEQYKQYLKIVEIFKNIDKEVVAIRGNHDTFDFEDNDKSYLMNKKLKDINNFIGIEYLNFNMYGSCREKSEEEIQWKLSKLDINNNSIILSHITPYKCLTMNKTGPYQGSISLKNMLKEKEPMMMFCGHVHEGFGVKKLYKTLVFNSACDKNIARGWIIDIETRKYKKLIIDL